MAVMTYISILMTEEPRPRELRAFSVVCAIMKLACVLVIYISVSANADTIHLSDIQKAIHGLGTMMEKTWPRRSNGDRKPIFELYTCLSLTKDLELLVFNRTEIFLEDERQTCSCRRVHGKLEQEAGILSGDSTFTTDLFIKMLITTITDYEDSQSLSQSFSHIRHPELSSRKNHSHIQELRDVLVKLTPLENAVQILTRFVVKRWALKRLNDLTVPVFELYTCSSLLKQAEEFVQKHPGVLRQLNIHRNKAWYVPCICHRMYELADSHCASIEQCSHSFSPVHTLYEERIHQVSKRMPLLPEISN